MAGFGQFRQILAGRLGAGKRTRYGIWIYCRPAEIGNDYIEYVSLGTS